MALHAALGVDYGVQVHGSPYGFDNSITEDFLKEHRGRVVGVAAIDPKIPEEKLKQPDASWLPGDAVREPLFAWNAAHLYRFSLA